MPPDAARRRVRPDTRHGTSDAPPGRRDAAKTAIFPRFFRPSRQKTLANALAREKNAHARERGASRESRGRGTIPGSPTSTRSYHTMATAKKPAAKKPAAKAAKATKATKAPAARKAAPAASAGKPVLAPAALKPIAEPLKKTDLMAKLAEIANVEIKHAKAVIAALEAVIVASLHKKGAKQFVLPGVFKATTVAKPATKARKGINPFTKEEVTFAAKPASVKVRVRALKKVNSAIAG
jgi:nucleoid DNA-binding protein